MKRLSFKEAYLVEEWATEIVKGHAAVVKQKGFISGSSDSILFSADMKSFSFEKEAKKVYQKGVFFDFGKAYEAMNHQKQEYTDFCKSQVTEYTEKLNHLNETK
jgi:hypothetical protein